MKVKFKHYEGLWFKFPQTVGELLNYQYMGEKVWIIYRGLSCPETKITNKQLGELYDPKRHDNLMVAGWYLGNDARLKDMIVINVEADRSLIPKRLIDYHEGKHLKKNNKEITDQQLSIFDMEVST